jgi:peptide/nickel transport system ATP-binding protein
MAPRAKVVEVDHLSVVLNQRVPRRILDDVSLDIHAEEVLGIIGQSGSGKTVLSRALVNWLHEPLRQVGGTIRFRGRDLAGLAPGEMQRLRGREIAYIGSDPGGALDPTLPVGHQIVEKLKSVEPGIAEAAARSRVLAMLDAVRMPSSARRFGEFPFQFSGGMMQRLMIVDALVTKPALLVADNITQPLDVTIAAQILRLLKDLQRDFKTAIAFVSSALGIVHDIADRVLVLADGRAVEQQPTRLLIERPAHDYTRRLIRDMPRIWDEGNPPGRSADPAGTEPVLSVRDIAKTYATRDRSKILGRQHVHAVRGVSFDVFRGENLGIIGESGCGKSTLSRLLSRVEPPDQGEIRFLGQDIAHMSRGDLLGLRRGFQLLLQDPFSAIPPHFTIGRTIAEPLYIHGGRGRAQIEAKVRATMGEVGLSAELYNSLPVGLSAGQRQRVNIARALVLEPELLILDETLSALDQVEQLRLVELFGELQRRRGITYIYISHDLSLVRRVCDRIAVMYLGRIVELATNAKIFFDPSHPYTRALLSAVPAIETRRFDAATYLLEGEPPSPIDIPPGCTFRTRCPFALEVCRTEDPPIASRGAGTQAACHLPGTSIFPESARRADAQGVQQPA